MPNLHICPLNPEAHDAETCPLKKGEIREGKMVDITPQGLWEFWRNGEMVFIRQSDEDDEC